MGTSLETLAQDNREQLAALQERIGYRFRDVRLLQQALIHSSFAFERMKSPRHNETLEFLGDAVLDLALGHLLFTRFPEMREGKLSKIRASLVNETGLAEMARAIGLGGHMLLGHGEHSSGGEEKSSILSCAYEAMLGALFLDGGFDEAQAFVRRWFEPLIERPHIELLATDAKSGLQEVLQEQYNEGPSYVLEEEIGPAHARVFTVSVRFRAETMGTGTASSKKEAEQRAARAALDRLNAEDH
ncbi:MAG TPA: ribonuclease III [Desulfobulbaceae bacterium]|jgi:ribonuclease-3|nr:ribonuclease III [Desulfobulbaceae bacterium]